MFLEGSCVWQVCSVTLKSVVAVHHQNVSLRQPLRPVLHVTSASTLCVCCRTW